MPDFSQANRPMRVDSVLGEDVLLLKSFSGTEAVSQPFSYTVDLYSEDAEIAPEDVLRTPLLLTVGLVEGGARRIHGFVRRFSQLGREEELTSYRAEIVPWFWFLSLSRECRIHQEKSVLEIVETVFGDMGYSDFAIRCSGSYPTREYCVQYRESHLAFVSRLLEEEGIFYFFEHEESKHTLVLADGNSSFQPVQDPTRVRMWKQTLRDEDVVTTLEREHAVHVGRVMLEDYDYLQPTLSLRSQLEGEDGEEVYDYHPRRYTTPDDGERYARILLEEAEARQQVVFGTGSCRNFESGRTFELLDHYRRDANQEYVLLQVAHSARAGDYRSWGDAPMDYDVSFVGIPKSVPFRPPRKTPRPVIQGSQTAEVVGKSGEEIWTDEHGRIKVQFHWDRLGQKDENSSCWVRVASTWAGKTWGQVHLPRIGQEVVVDFLEGDPDRPLVIGSVYNADQRPPYTLPADQTKSGMKSRSSKGGGGYNEISIDDKKGSEKITVHGQKDLSETILNDRTRSVGNDETVTVQNNQTVTVKDGDASLYVDTNKRVVIVEDQYYRLAKTVYEEGTEKIESRVGEQWTTTDTGKIELKATGSSTHTLTSSKIESKVGAQSTSTVEDGTVTLKVGGATVTVTSSQVELKMGGSTVTLTGSAVEVKGGQVKLNC